MDRFVPALNPPVLGLERGATRLGIMAVALAAALLLAFPVTTVVTDRLDRLFLIFDGIHRIEAGQIPGRDFHTALGPLAFYLPWTGYRLTGSYGGALPIAMAIAALVLGAIASRLLADRLRPPLALLFAAFIMLILAAPNNPGEPLNILSFDQFWNRIGWVALALLLVMWLEPIRRRQTFRTDAICAAGLTLILLFTRPTYGLVALALLAGLSLAPGRRRTATAALIMVIPSALVISWLWGGLIPYLGDVWMVWQAGGILRGSWGQILDHVLANLADVLLLGLMAGIAMWRQPSTGDLVFFAFCAIAGFWLINHNDQRWGIISIHAAFFVAVELFLRRRDERGLPDGAWANGAGVMLFSMLMTVPTIVHGTAALGLHTIAALGANGRPVELGGIDRVKIADLWTEPAFRRANWYLGTVEDGMRALADARASGSRILVLSEPDPFSAALLLPPAPGTMPDMRWLATVTEAAHVPPESLLANVDLVMERTSAGGAGKVGDLYLPAVRSAFEQIAQTPNWRLYRQRATAAPATEPAAP